MKYVKIIQSALPEVNGKTLLVRQVDYKDGFVTYLLQNEETEKLYTISLDLDSNARIKSTKSNFWAEIQAYDRCEHKPAPIKMNLLAAKVLTAEQFKRTRLPLL